MKESSSSDGGLIQLEVDKPVWGRFFTVSPLVLIGSREQDGAYNFAPKHMALQLGWDNYFGFVCTPRHSTYQNIQREGAFTVSYPRHSQVVLASLAATARTGDCVSPQLGALPTFQACKIDGRFVEDASLFLECRLDRVVEGFGENSLIAGRIVTAHVPEEALRRTEVDDHDVIFRSPLLAYLNPGRFASIENSFSFPFPADFKK